METKEILLVLVGAIIGFFAGAFSVIAYITFKLAMEHLG